MSEYVWNPKPDITSRYPDNGSSKFDENRFRYSKHKCATFSLLLVSSLSIVKTATQMNCGTKAGDVKSAVKNAGIPKRRVGLLIWVKPWVKSKAEASKNLMVNLMANLMPKRWAHGAHMVHNLLNHFYSLALWLREPNGSKNTKKVC